MITLTDTITVTEYGQWGTDRDILGAAWVSTSQDDATERLATAGEKRLDGTLAALIRDRHGSPFEEGYLSITVEAPIWLMREWQRHRTTSSDDPWDSDRSFSEQSQRYVELLPHFWFPARTRPLRKAQGHSQMRPRYEALPETIEGDEPYRIMRQDWLKACEVAWNAYTYWTEQGMPREVTARILGINVYTRSRVRLNPRSIMSFLSLRVHEERHMYAATQFLNGEKVKFPWALFPSYPQYEIEQAARQLEAIFERYWPVTHTAFCDYGRVGP